MIYKSYVVQIDTVTNHPNADKLDLVTMCNLGWTCIVARDSMKQGDLAVFIETDSVLPQQLMDIIFANSKIKPSNGRIRSVKIRGVYSEGLVVPLDILGTNESVKILGSYVDGILGITKYEPPQEELSIPKVNKSKLKSKVRDIPRYIDTTRIEKVPRDFFADDEIVHVTAKLHGTSVRFGWAEIFYKNFIINVLYKLLVLLRLAPKYKFVAGSRNVDSPSNVLYSQCAEQYCIESILPYNYQLFGEIVGFSKSGKAIQGNGYDYSCAPNCFSFYAYALMIDGKYVDYDEFLKWCHTYGVPVVPLLAICPWLEIKGRISDMLNERCAIETQIPCREGLVIGSKKEQYHPNTGTRKLVKVINPEYLLNKNNTDVH